MVVATALTAPQLASSAPSADPRAEREKVRAERAEVAAQIDTNKASRRELDAALRVLQENLDTQEAALARAEAAVAQAEQDIADAESAITSLTIQVRILKKVMRERAVRAFVSPPGDDVLTVLETKDFTTAAARKFYIELRAQDDADVTDRLEGANVDLAYQKRKATAAKNSSTATGQVAAGVASTRTTPNRPVPADESAPTMRTRMINLEDVTLPSGYLPSPSEEYMCPRQLLYFRNKLMQWRDELIAESQETLDHLRSEIRDVGDEAERASRESDNILELRTRDRYRKLLNKIDAAMKRIEDGSYGYCEETGEEIGLGRLEARPIATLTVDAQERREMLQRQFRDDR